MKALYFREACNATEDYDLRKSSISRAKQIPNPEDVIAIHGEEELYITTKGLMWSKDVLGTPKGEQILLGTANIISAEEVGEDEWERQIVSIINIKSWVNVMEIVL